MRFVRSNRRGVIDPACCARAPHCGSNRSHLSRNAQRAGLNVGPRSAGFIRVMRRFSPACSARALHCGSNEIADLSRYAQRAGLNRLGARSAGLPYRIMASSIPHAPLGLCIAAQMRLADLSRYAQRAGLNFGPRLRGDDCP